MFFPPRPTKIKKAENVKADHDIRKNPLAKLGLNFQKEKNVSCFTFYKEG